MESWSLYFMSPDSEILRDRRNILICGDTGVGKSSLVNLIAGEDLAITSSGISSCTPQPTKYAVSIENVEFALYDMTSLHKSQVHMKKAEYLDPVFQAYALICRLERLGGISLLVFCMKGGLISVTSQQTYNLFVEVFCSRQIPVLIAVTHLEMHDPMESWWKENQKDREAYEFRCHAHACITATRGFRNCFAKKYEESRELVRKLLLEHSGPKEEKATWTKWARIGLSPRPGKDLSGSELRRTLIKRCGFSREDARLVAMRMEEERHYREDPRSDASKSEDSLDLVKGLSGMKSISNPADEPLRVQCAASQQQDSLNETIRKLRADVHSLKAYSANLEKTNQELRNQLAASQLATNQKDEIIRVHEKKYQCEAFYTCGRVYDAVKSLSEIMDTSCEDLRANKLIDDWLTEFTQRCVTTLERLGDEASNAKEHDGVIVAYSTALSLTPSTPMSVLTKWARIMLFHCSADEALVAAAEFKLPRFKVYWAICEALKEDGRIAEATECFRSMQNELQEDTNINDERVRWELCFRGCCVEKLEELGNNAMDAKNYSGAIGYYSNALSLDPSNTNDLLIKCCKARRGLLEEALVNAIKFIEVNPSSHEGYKRKYTVLRCMGHHGDAFREFETMLSKIAISTSPRIREFHNQYVDATPTIRRIILQTIRHTPRILIDTTSGRLYDKSQQAAAFEKLTIFNELRSLMTARVDEARIRRAVKKYYRYVMFSHKWEDGEPLFQMVKNISVYELDLSSPNIKLQRLCALSRSLGFQWVWSDTCCIDKTDNVVLQESLVAMFTWYRGSSLTVIYLRGVWSQRRKLGDLRDSIWNTRAWTYQEYVAAETVQFYTEDWKPYLDLTIYNHKESPAIISEMQQAVGDFTQELAVLRPDLERVREKLYVASTRQTTHVEDIAYSLLGIFNAAIPVIYGESDRAVGRLLEHVLTGSGDVMILAWTGRAGSYNSCLPVDLAVYNRLVPPHVPQPIETAEVERMVTTLHSSLPDLSQAVTLHGRLNELPSPTMHASRLRLSGITFPLADLVDSAQPDSDSDLHVYRATTTLLGDVEIRTKDNLSETDDLLLIHPWISPLLDQDFSRRVTGVDPTTRALRLVARMRLRPFGALLLVPLSRVQYKRVAADSLIMVQIRTGASLGELMDGIRTVDIQ